MLYSMSQGQTFEGMPGNWVSTLSIGVIQKFLDDTLLPALGTVESAYKLLLTAA
jgi:hypothetical protein